jgi:ferric-dicitrate binding protein FerR (iron transport regulator)
MSGGNETAECPQASVLAQAFPDGADEALRRHLERCERCRKEWAALAELVRLSQKLPFAAPDATRHQRQRQALLQRAAALDLSPPHGEGRSGRAVPGGRWFVPLTAAAAALLFVGLSFFSWSWQRSRGEDLAAPLHGRVLALGKASFSHRGTSQDEVVQLIEGTLQIEVSPLKPGERFRVVTEDGEVEVRGTAFEVTAAGARLSGVNVDHGRVEVRPARGPMVVLSAGQGWRPPGPVTRTEGAPGAAEAVASQKTGPPADSLGPATAGALQQARGRRRLSHRAALVDPADPAGRAFEQGWALVLDGRYGAAAAAFERASRAGGPIAEDAAYWRGVALARGGHSTEGIAAMSRFLSHYPHSPRAAEAASILGWLLFDRGELDESARRFRLSAASGDAAVQHSARKGLAAIAAVQKRGLVTR